MKSYYNRQKAKKIYICLIIAGIVGLLGSSLAFCFRSLDFLAPFFGTLAAVSFATTIGSLIAFVVSNID